MTRSPLSIALCAAALFLACEAPADQVSSLGPADGHDLPETELERVAIGQEAPLFALESFHGDTVSLDQFRGDKNVVLVFYRGHW